jgi:hypothetical protein
MNEHSTSLFQQACLSRLDEVARRHGTATKHNIRTGVIPVLSPLPQTIVQVAVGPITVVLYKDEAGVEIPGNGTAWNGHRGNGRGFERADYASESDLIDDIARYVESQLSGASPSTG